MHYPIFLLCTSVLCGIAGLAAHFYRAWVGQNENPLYEKGPIIVQTQNPSFGGDPFFERRVLKADFDDNGAWDGNSFKNMAYMTGYGAIPPLVAGVFAWPVRAEILANTCMQIAHLGVKPVFCF